MRGPADSYDAIADAYADRFHDELAHKPFDRMWLDRFASRVNDARNDAKTAHPVVDLGCGPGHVAAALSSRGLDAIGVDLSPAMIAEATRRNPGVAFRVDDMLALSFADASLAGAVAFYAIVHFTLDECTRAFAEIARALAPGAPLALAFHVDDAGGGPGASGTRIVHVDELLGRRVSMDFVFFDPDAIAARVRAAGFRIDDVVLRWSYPDVEYPSRRAYLLATRV